MTASRTSAPLLSVKSAAAELNLTPRAVLYRIERGEITATKIGDGRTSSYVIEAGEIARLKREQRSQQKAGA